MRYWLDTEFVEDGRTIDLISIGIVAEDGREYYAVSSEFDPKKASGWVKENVLVHLPPKMHQNEMSPREREEAQAWKSRSQIADEVVKFCGGESKPEFWGYYADYDWVVFCQLFGTMMDLPKGFPMYCRDLKQWCDDLGNPKLPEQGKGEHHALADARWNRRAWEFLRAYSVERSPFDRLEWAESEKPQ